MEPNAFTRTGTNLTVGEEELAGAFREEEPTSWPSVAPSGGAMTRPIADVSWWTTVDRIITARMVRRGGTPQTDGLWYGNLE